MENQEPTTQPQMPVQPIPDPIQTPVEPTFEPKKSLPKWPFVILAIIIVIVAIILSPIFLFQVAVNKLPSPQVEKQVVSPTPTTNPTTGWQTYTNTKAGVEFRYPATWTLKSEPDWTLTVFLENHPFEIPQSEPPLTSITVAFNEQGNLGERTFREKTLAEGQQNIETLFDKTTIKVKHLSVGGKDAIQISGQGTGLLNGYLEYTLIQMDNKITNKAADNIRILSASMVEKAKSGHPGGAMGGADFINILYSVLHTQIPYPNLSSC